jgi:hypothetical protein
MKIRVCLAAALSAASCQDAPEPAPVTSNELTTESVAAPAPDIAPVVPSETLETGEVGPIRLRYDPRFLVPVETTVSVPPDWASEVPGVKLVASERAELIGKAECLYGLFGQASVCNARQEAGIAFAMVDEPYEALSQRLSGPLREDISLAGRKGVSWTVGAEGEGAEHILLPAGDRTALIVRQHRTSGNPPEEAVAAVLDGLRLVANSP